MFMEAEMKNKNMKSDKDTLYALLDVYKYMHIQI
jgi:hypothetical protein